MDTMYDNYRRVDPLPTTKGRKQCTVKTKQLDCAEAKFQYLKKHGTNYELHEYLKEATEWSFSDFDYEVSLNNFNRSDTATEFFKLNDIL